MSQGETGARSADPEQFSDRIVSSLEFLLTDAPKESHQLKSRMFHKIGWDSRKAAIKEETEAYLQGPYRNADYAEYQVSHETPRSETSLLSLIMGNEPITLTGERYIFRVVDFTRFMASEKEVPVPIELAKFTVLMDVSQSPQICYGESTTPINETLRTSFERIVDRALELSGKD